MDTKSKRFSDWFGVRALAFFLCVIFGTAAVTGFVGLFKIDFGGLTPGDLRNFFVDRNYRESYSMQMDLAGRFSSLAYQFQAYKSEDYIAAGKAIDEDTVNDAIHDLIYYGAWSYDRDTIRREAPELRPWREDLESASGYERNAIIAEFARQNKDSVEKIKQVVIANQLRNFRLNVKELKQIKGFDFYISDGEYVLTNQIITSGSSVNMAAFKEKPAYLIYSNDEIIKYPVAPARYKYIDNEIKQNLSINYADPATSFTGCISFDDSYLAERAAMFDSVKAQLMVLAPTILGGSLLALILLLYLFSATGRRGRNNEVVLYAFDRVFIEVQIAAMIAVAVGMWILLDYAVTFTRYNWASTGSYVDVLLFALPLAALASIGLWFLLSCIRNMKAGTFIRTTIIGKLCILFYRGAHRVFDRQNPMTKLVVVALALILLSATVVLAPVMLVLVLIFAPRWLEKYAAVKKGVDEVRNGNLSWQIPVADDAHSEFDELARGINEISNASGVAIRNELKNQRLKTDLISNVSHDLKTPLTSIITYIDLLKREGLTSPSAPEYLDILDQKSRRLQKLTEDLFDAAKASSGTIPVHFERVDILSLVRQGLGEMNTGFAAARLEVILNATNEKYYVKADGQLLWRIVENLMGNVLKYALEGSRVYIDIVERDVQGREILTILEMKNISRASLNIPADELMERFKRGDESRTTEGSGLGLAIAKDLARLQNGWFEVVVDGDLFKAKLILEPWRDAPEQSPPQTVYNGGSDYNGGC
ncbi:MAG: HAMP domain-containing histidine kinase [Clostridiales Family XIII bacterium]|nr:HAMP domain-containing histidine kinase [Clostridiales Family XIII bacterium]